MTSCFVSPSGSDQNPGTEEAPLQSLAAAKDRVRKTIASFADDEVEDITVQLTAGIHHLTEPLELGLQDGGDDRFNVTWQGSPEGDTILSAGVPLQGWKRCEEDLPDIPEEFRDRVWVIDLPAGTGMATLYGPQGPVPRARGKGLQPIKTPPSDHPHPALYGPNGPIATHNIEEEDTIWHHDRFGFQEGAIPCASDLHEAQLVIIPAMQWAMNILPIREVDFQHHVVHLDAPCTYPIGIPHCSPDASIWLQNSLSVLSPGHWVFHAETARLYYCPVSGEPEEGLERGGLIEMIRLEGNDTPGTPIKPVKGIHFRHLNFTHSNTYSFNGLTGKGLQHDWEMHDTGTAMLRFRHAEACGASNCTFTRGGSAGVRMDLACRNNRVENCTFSDLGGCGVVLSGYGPSRTYANRNNVITGNTIHHIGQLYWHCPGIFIWQSGENHIADNDLADLPYTGIVCSGRILYDREGKAECSRTINWEDVEDQCGKGYVKTFWPYAGLIDWWVREPLTHARDNLIEFNRIRDVMQVMGDGNGIYISGAGGGNVIRFNVVGPCSSPNMAEAIRCDDDQHQTIIHGNLVHQQGGRATGITLKGINRVTNNILALPQTTPLRAHLSLETGPLNGSVIERNIFLTSAPDQRFVHEMRIHGQGRKARLRDTESNRNLYWCTGDPGEGERFLQEARSFGTDTDSCAADPRFRDAENGDFTLDPTSPALECGFQPLPLDRMFGRT